MFAPASHLHTLTLYNEAVETVLRFHIHVYDGLVGVAVPSSMLAVIWQVGAPNVDWKS